MSKETLSSLLLDMKGANNISITEEEALKIEIERCDSKIEYYQELKRDLEAKLEILNRKK